LKPVFNELYDSVKNGTETKRSLEFNGQPDYREKLEAELKTIRELEIWRAGKAVRSVEPIYSGCIVVANMSLQVSPTRESGVNRYPKVDCFSSQALRTDSRQLLKLQFMSPKFSRASPNFDGICSQVATMTLSLRISALPISTLKIAALLPVLSLAVDKPQLSDSEQNGRP